MDLKNLFGYEGKTVVVSGAYSGMGLAAARLLHELGANVYTICRLTRATLFGNSLHI